MKRSDINRALRDGEHLAADLGFALPPFAFWTPQQWQQRGPAARELTRLGLGWDLTDFGLEDYAHFGLLLFTLRNGDVEQLGVAGQQPYAEKILIVGENQITTFHLHRRKIEDIINRGGATLELTLYNEGEPGKLADTPVSVQIDGLTTSLEAGALVKLAPGSSITLRPGQFHQFTARGGPVLAGEVSSVNDDHADNIFLESQRRFPTVEEDETPYRLLVGDYARLNG